MGGERIGAEGQNANQESAWDGFMDVDEYKTQAVEKAPVEQEQGENSDERELLIESTEEKIKNYSAFKRRFFIAGVALGMAFGVVAFDNDKKKAAAVPSASDTIAEYSTEPDDLFPDEGINSQNEKLEKIDASGVGDFYRETSDYIDEMKDLMGQNQDQQGAEVPHSETDN